MGWALFWSFSTITCLAASSHVACMTTCPGVMPRDVVSHEELAKQGVVTRGQRGVVPICRKCLNYKLKGMHMPTRSLSHSFLWRTLEDCVRVPRDRD